jgi:hypothetical protein
MKRWSFWNFSPTKKKFFSNVLCRRAQRNFYRAQRNFFSCEQNFCGAQRNFCGERYYVKFSPKGVDFTPIRHLKTGVL